MQKAPTPLTFSMLTPLRSWRSAAAMAGFFLAVSRLSGASDAAEHHQHHRPGQPHRHGVRIDPPHKSHTTNHVPATLVSATARAAASTWEGGLAGTEAVRLEHVELHVLAVTSPHTTSYPSCRQRPHFVSSPHCNF